MLPIALLAVAAALLLTAGTAFVVETLQRLFSQDYRALARMAPALPPITVFGRLWQPAAAPTWLVPAGLLAAGAAFAWAARSRLFALAPATPRMVPAAS